MKRTVIILFLIIALLTTVLTVSASAEDADSPDDWDTIVSRFLSENKCLNESVALGYYNTVTGEEHYYRGDKYMETGSTYKVPLNMVYAERIYNGEMDFDTTIGVQKYQYLQRQTIVYSNNDYATLLWQNIGKNNEYGNYKAFRTAIAPYMGVDPDNVDPMYYKNRFFTAEQVVHCLKTLYSDPERFPGIIDCMLLAEQDNYFCYHTQDYPIAHKYGYIFENGCLYICDSGICYTDDPIIIVMFTANVRHPNALLADYCTLMCDYTEEARLFRLSATNAENDSSIPVSDNAFNSFEPAIVTTEPSKLREPEPVKEHPQIMPLIIICALSLTAIAAMIIAAARKKVRPVSALMSVLFASSALFLCVSGMSRGLIFAKTEGDPCDAIHGFFDDIVSGDFTSACDFLADYSDIGLDTDTDDAVSAEMLRALRDSYDYELIGDCVTEGLSAKQKVKVKYLDFSKMSSDLQFNTNECIRQLVERLSKNEIFDASGEYLDSFIAEAYAEAAEITLSHVDDFYSFAVVDIDLIYRDDHWLMNTNQALLAALSGGA